MSNEQKIQNAKAMKTFAATVAGEIVARPVSKNARVVALYGDLGAGKTTFAQGFLKELGIKSRVISPTFLIIRNYKVAKGGLASVYHIDCYRLHTPEELLALGLQEFISNPSNILLIEWPELIEHYLPGDTMRIAIEHPDKGTTRTARIL